MNPQSKRALPILALALAVFALPAAAADGWLGIHMQDLSGSMAKALQLPDTGGVLVSEVVADSPAAAAGLEDGDVVVAFAGDPIGDIADLTRAVQATDPDTEVTITVVRGGEKRDLRATIGEREPETMVFRQRGPGGDWRQAPLPEGGVHVWHDDEDGPVVVAPRMAMRFGSGGYLGLGLQDLGEQLGAYFGVEGGDGALVTEVYEDSPAATAGLRAGDVIVDFGGTDIDDRDDLVRAARRADPGDEVEVTLVRDRRERTVSLTVGERPVDQQLSRPDDLPEMMRQYGTRWQWHDRDREEARREQDRMMREFHERQREMSDDREEIQELHEELQRLQEQLQALKEDLHQRSQ